MASSPASPLEELCQQFYYMNLNMLAWSKAYIQKNFNINGKCPSVLGDLTLQQFHVLLVIQRMQQHTVSEIAATLNLSKSSLSLTIGKMVKAGLIAATPATEHEDKRKTYLSLTDAGILAIHHAETHLFESIHDFLRQVPANKLKKLSHAMEEINALFEIGGNDNE